MNPDRKCTWCGNNFENPKNSVTKSQAIWVRMHVWMNSELLFIRGAVCGKCRNQLAEVQVSPMTLKKLLSA